MSLSNGSSEAEFESEVGGSGSKVSDDSGIEDTWNEDISHNVTAKAHNMQDSAMAVGEMNQRADDLSFKGFTPLTPPEEENQLHGTPAIYPTFPCRSVVEVIRNDVKDQNAIPGACGIENLGNTCFMNAGLQCLFATPSLQKLIQNEKSLGSIGNAENSKAMITMINKFQDMFRKVMTGEYQSLYPIDFHNALTQVHAILGDHKQHDCQEFLSFLLNGLHDALNSADPRRRHSPRKCLQQSLGSRESSPTISNLRLETSSESDNDENDSCRDESSKRMRLDNLDAEPDVGVECDERLSEAQNAWSKYIKDNRSIIVETFQGQFKSMVTCEKCHHVSVTYEPFMHISVPLPHANEKQIVVIWHSLSRPGQPSQATRYLTTVSKNGCVGDVKNQLFKAIHGIGNLNSGNIVMAEVSNSTITRTLVDHMKVQYLDSKGERIIYAIETQPDDKISNDSCSVINQEAKEIGDDSHGNEARPDGTDGVESKSIINRSATGWHTCGICLEDIFDDDLMVHQVCGGVLCRDCLQATSSYHSDQNFPCPVCNATVDEKTYKPISEHIQSGVRTVLVPVFMRCKRNLESTNTETTTCIGKLQTFGHPLILSLPCQVESSTIHEEIFKLLNCRSDLDYSLHFTDYQGLTCSRCDTFAACTGCCLESDGMVQLKPGDHLTIDFDVLSNGCLDLLSAVTNDESLALLRDDDVIQLTECFQFFSECETLSEENPWFCPKCRRNQIAIKAISVSKWPDVLIVHLKRFHFEGLRSVKIKNPVQFPCENFNLDFVSSAETAAKENCSYDLIGCVCHSGSLMSGHYTSYCKNFANSAWYNFNDEIISQVDPTSIDHEKVYMLFYQRINPWNASPTM